MRMKLLSEKFTNTSTTAAGIRRTAQILRKNDGDRNDGCNQTANLRTQIEDRRYRTYLDLTRDEYAHQQTVDRRHGASLGRCEHSGVYADQNDGHRAGRIFRAERRSPKLSPAERKPRSITVALGCPPGHNAHETDHYETGQRACDEQIADADVDGDAVQHERNARRNDDAGYATGGYRRGGESRRIALLLHAGKNDSADGGDSGRVGAADCGEKACRNDGRLRQSAVCPANQRAREVHDVPRDTARVYQVARDHEQRQGDEREEIERIEHRQADVHERELSRHQRQQDSADTEDGNDLHSKKEQHQNEDGNPSARIHGGGLSHHVWCQSFQCHHFAL